MEAATQTLPSNVISRENEYTEKLAEIRKNDSERWDKVALDVKKEEEEDTPEGAGALQHLFKGIYKNADADTRRAMIKSYQTSGGIHSKPTIKTHPLPLKKHLFTLY